MTPRPPPQARRNRPSPVAAGYSHVNLMVDDLDAALAFYTEVMGFELLPRPDFGEFARGAWLGHGAAQIHLSVVDEMVPRKGFAPHLALHIPAAQYQETMDALRDRGVAFIGEPRSRRLRHDRDLGGLHRGPLRQPHRADRRGSR